MVPEPVEGAVIKQDRCRILRLRSAILRTCSAQSCVIGSLSLSKGPRLSKTNAGRFDYAHQSCVIGSLSNVEGSAISKTAAGRLRYCKPWRRLYFLLVPALHFHQFLFIPLFLKVCCVFDRKELCEHGIHHGENLRQGDFFITCE